MIGPVERSCSKIGVPADCAHMAKSPQGFDVIWPQVHNGSTRQTFVTITYCVVARAYVPPQVPMEHVPEVFQQAFPGLVEVRESRGRGALLPLPHRLRLVVV